MGPRMIHLIVRTAIKRDNLFDVSNEGATMLTAIHFLRRSRLIVAAMLCGLATLAATPAWPQAPTGGVAIKKVPVQQSNEVSGSKLFHSYCAACHGQDGKGDGPAAPAFKKPPADLTALAKDNGGVFPADHVLQVLTSNSSDATHGSKDMPVWGPIFRRMGSDQSLGYLRSKNVMEYLRTIQVQ